MIALMALPPEVLVAGALGGLALAVTFAILLIVSSIFWMNSIQKLTDKLMSRDFADYQRAKEQKNSNFADEVNRKAREMARESFDHPPEDIRGMMSEFST